LEGELKMKIHGVVQVIGLFALIALASGGCSVTTPALTPSTAVPAAATSTPVPATATTVPPTNPPAATSLPSGTSLSASGTLGLALEKAKGASVYRVDMQVTGKGNFGLGGPATPEPNATPPTPTDQEVTLVSMQGEVNGKDSHLTLQGLFAAFLGIDPTKSLEVISTGDKYYIHGPVALLGANEDKWYELPAGESSVATPPLTPNSFLDSFTSTGLDPKDFQKTSTESFDNRQCDVYSGDKVVIDKIFKSVGQAAGAGNWSTIDSAEFKFWICDDGFLHQLRLAAAGHSQEQPDQKGSFLMQMHVYDFGTNIKIEAPANAELLNMPSFINLGTPTP
jgi:hypothetical protein